MDAEELRKQIKEVIPGAEVHVDASATVGGTHFMDVAVGQRRATLEIRPQKQNFVARYFVLAPSEYGLSVHDEDSAGFGEGPDCIFGHVPTLLKYVKKLLAP